MYPKSGPIMTHTLRLGAAVREPLASARVSVVQYFQDRYATGCSNIRFITVPMYVCTSLAGRNGGKVYIISIFLAS